MIDEMKKIIETYEEKGDFTYTTITEDQIVEAQNILGVELPAQYLDFLLRFRALLHFRLLIRQKQICIRKK